MFTSFRTQMMLRHLTTLLLALLSLRGLADNGHRINFESQDYAAVGVYDLWEVSPFTRGLLKGNCAVVDNPFVNDKNRSAKVLACQRSLYGSNLFGARIDLLPEQRFRLSPTKKYVHVLMHKLIAGRSLLIALGRHTSSEWSHQSPEVVQATSLNSYQPSHATWSDAIFPISGYDDVEICALVVVFDCESPHRLSSPFIAYLDGIEINSKSYPRYVLDDYPLSFDAEQAAASDESYDIELNVAGKSTFIAPPPSPQQLIYSSCLAPCIDACPGDLVKLTPNINIADLNTYVYLDRNNDGRFHASLNADGTPTADSELMTHSYYWGHDACAEPAEGSSLQPPSFVIPADLPPAKYRLRIKLDRNNTEPSGSSHMASCDGRIIDCLLNVHPPMVSIAAEVRSALDPSLPPISIFEDRQQPFATPFSMDIRKLPHGKDIDRIVIRHGYNLDGDSIVCSNQQYADVTISGADLTDGCIDIPSELIDGHLRITIFSNYKDEDVFYDLHGRLHHTRPSGIYIEGKKKHVRFAPAQD